MSDTLEQPNLKPQVKPASAANDDRREAHRPGAETKAIVTRRRVSDGAAVPIIPDTLNIGIAARMILIVAGALFLVAALTAAPGHFMAFLSDVCLFVAPVLFGSMLLIGFARPKANGLTRQQQWAVVLAIPALVALGVSLLYQRTVLDDQGIQLPWTVLRVLVSVAAAAALVEYMSLRARAFSPSLSEARLQALQARIRPHFLFNSLNTVLGMMRSQPRLAETTLENLSELFRVFMKDTRELIPLQDEIETCRQYLAIEQIRLGGRLSVDWQIEGGPADALVPSLLLQPLVENAVHHGIEPSTSNGTIAIFAAKVGEKVEVKVFNPVVAEQPTRPGNQMALGNVRERLMLLYDMEAELKTVNSDGQFQLTLTFPYRKERRRRDVRIHLINPHS